MKPLLLITSILLFNFTVLAQTSFFTVSKGGGITGAATVYKFSLNGKVLKGSGLSPIVYTEETKLKKSKVKKCAKRVQRLLTSFPDFNHPGNIYYSIALVEKDKEHKMVWGDNKQPVPDEAMEAYNEIHTVLSQLSFTKIISQQ
jgi:hypothetical protein